MHNIHMKNGKKKMKKDCLDCKSRKGWGDGREMHFL